MAQYIFVRDEFDLCTSRPRLAHIVDEDPEIERKKDESNERHKLLNGDSRTLQRDLRKNRILEHCEQFAAYLLDNPRTDELPEVSVSTSSRSFPSRPDASNEEAILQSRKISAQESQKRLSFVLKQINGHILTHCGIHGLETTVERDEPKFFYRLTHEESYTLYDWDFGFICGKWRSASGPFFNPPTGENFWNHMSGQKTPTPYISMTESPGRLWNIIQAVKRKEGEEKRVLNPAIAIIDASKLRRMGIDFTRSTDLGARFANSRPRNDTATTYYITWSQWLARFWIPKECIVKTISLDDFINACKEYKILNSECSPRPSRAGEITGPADNHRR